jgi:MFS family permease
VRDSNPILIALTVIGFTGCLLALILEMILLALYKGTTNKSGQAAAVAFLFIHVGFYSVCIDATTYIYATEIFPSYLRARGSSICISGLFFATVIFTCAAPEAFTNIGWKYYIIFAVLTAMMAVAIWVYWPETKGLSLEEINAIFGDQVAVDITHLTQEERDALDQGILNEKGGITSIEHMETTTHSKA